MAPGTRPDTGRGRSSSRGERYARPPPMAVTKASRRFFLLFVLLLAVVLLVISIADDVRARNGLDAEADENEDKEEDIDDDDTDNGIATPNAVVVAAA